jgi:DNA/RNA endonuclease YhcR with UshA esterase domain
MREKLLFKTALICVVVGIVGLWFLSSNISVDEVVISKITLANVEDDVKIVGKVRSVRNFESVSMIDVVQEERIKVVMFVENVTLAIGDEIEVYGEVEEYKGEPEIIAHVIKVRK